MRSSWLIATALFLASLVQVLRYPAEAAGERIAYYESTGMQLQAADPIGVVEPPVPIYFDDQLIHGHYHQVTELYRRVPGTNHKPLVLADLVSSTFLRPSYLKGDGSGGKLGTSVLSAPSFRTAAGLQYVPQVDSARIAVPSSEDYQSTVAYYHANQLTGTTVLDSAPSVLDESRFQVHTSWSVASDINLASSAIFQSSDRFRLLTVSSMFSSGSLYDANLIRFETADGGIAELRLAGSMGRDRHLFGKAIELGSWLELVNEPGSIWTPDNASIRIELPSDRHLRLGLQGYLSGSLLPSEDSLSLWLEWLDAPDRVKAGTNFDMNYTLIAKSPRIVPEPAAVWLALLSLPGLRRRLLQRRKHRRCRGSSEDSAECRR